VHFEGGAVSLEKERAWTVVWRENQRFSGADRTVFGSWRADSLKAPKRSCRAAAALLYLIY